MSWYLLTDTGSVCFDPLPQANPHPLLPMLHSLPKLRGFAYGDGFFTTIGVHYDQVLGLNYHQARIDGHCEALDIVLSTNQRRQLWQEVTQFASNMGHGVIKVIVSRPNQSVRGYAYSTDSQRNTALICIGVMPSAPLSKHYADFLTLSSLKSDSNGSHKVNQQTPILLQPPIVATCLSAQLSSLPLPIAGLKILNRLDSVMIAGELERVKQTYSQVTEGLVQDMQGNWVEGVMSNVFYQLHDKAQQAGDEIKSKIANTSITQPWFTPPIVSSGVRGTMRQAIIDRLDALGQPVIMRPLRDDDLSHLTSMFFCNAVRGIMPVEKLILSGGNQLELSLGGFTENLVSR